MYRFMYRPRWILSHVLIVLLVVVMVNLGLWQARKLHNIKHYNALVRGRETQPVKPIDDVLRASATFDGAKSATYRRVDVSGHYDLPNQVIVQGRSLNEQPGAWVLTPLVTAGGAAVLVNRGWFGDPGVPDRAPAAADPPSGPVTVTGMLLPTQTRGILGPHDPSTGHLTALVRADVGRVQQQVPYDLYPAYLLLETQTPKQAGALPVKLDPPELDEGPYFSYSVQWFIFSTIAVVGYPLILRRTARNKAADRRKAATAAGPVAA